VGRRGRKVAWIEIAGEPIEDRGAVYMVEQPRASVASCAHFSRKKAMSAKMLSRTTLK
jgi:hypothetical protein